MRPDFFSVVRRIGEAQHPGPGKFRLHRRGKRSAEARDTRRARKVHHDASKADHAPGDAMEVTGESHEPNDGQEIQRMLVVWHVNIQGLRSSVAELVARIRLASKPPMILCLNETFLNQSIGEVEVEGFDLIARWDRSYERGGVCVYVSCDVSQNVTLLSKSADAERLWCMLHTEQGPFLLGAWYTPLGSDSSTIETCEREHDTLAGGALGTILLGDLNLHHKKWLIHSVETSSCGKRMRPAAAHIGLRQLVKEPTRGKNLLDLALSDIPGAKASVHPKIADHSIVEVCMPPPAPEVLTIKNRKYGNFAQPTGNALLLFCRRRIGQIFQA